MADQYSTAPIQSAVSRQLASFIATHFSQVTSKANSRIRVLEIGGGTCGTTRYALEELAKLAAGNRYITYTFTDISPAFVAAARRELGKGYPSIALEFRSLDITAEPLPVELLESYDLVIATNVMHATPSVCASVRNARQLLRPSGQGSGGGVLALVEYTQRMPMLDVIFGQLEGWWAFDDGREHALLSDEQWTVALQRAGYQSVNCTRSQSQDPDIMQIILAA